MGDRSGGFWRQTNKTSLQTRGVSGLRKRLGALVRALRGGAFPALLLLPGSGVAEVFIARTVNMYVLAGAVVAGLLFIFIMFYAINEMFKH